MKRFDDRYIPVTETGCWLWTGSTHKQGYGQLFVDKKYITSAHRYSYELHKGPIPEGLEIDHLCRQRSCVNPAHLEAVTHAENIRRGETGSNFRNVTHCPQGHEYNEENTYIRKLKTGGTARKCRMCERLAAREYRERLKLKQKKFPGG
jgi:hypothetical protein